MTMFVPLSSTAATLAVLTDQSVSASEKFYTQDQDLRVMPLQRINALEQAEVAPFMADSLGRYAYLPNPRSPEPSLPVGFTAAKENGDKFRHDLLRLIWEWLVLSLKNRESLLNTLTSWSLDADIHENNHMIYWS
ncbi:MAG: hypothetical protein Q7T96_10485 [Methylobacter sp.]|nr:hypothetical protein [Methylobacter sp.]